MGVNLVFFQYIDKLGTAIVFINITISIMFTCLNLAVFLFFPL